MKISKRTVVLFVLACIGLSLMIMPVYSDQIPASCTHVESGSSITMSVVNLRTTTSARFVVSSSENTPVELNHDIRVTDLGGLPSQGKASAFIQGIIQEGRNSYTKVYENIEFEERTTVDGNITLFNKNMRYFSGIKR